MVVAHELARNSPTIEDNISGVDELKEPARNEQPGECPLVFRAGARALAKDWLYFVEPQCIQLF